MAEHSSGNHSNGMDEHRSTYEGFIKGAVALSIICGFVLVALCSSALPIRSMFLPDLRA